MRLEGRVAVVTGGGRGIGRAIAELFYREGARVAVASRNTKNLQSFTTELNSGDHRIVPFRCDVTNRDEVEVMVGNVVEVWERVDILVNNAGISGFTPIEPGDAPGVQEEADRKWLEILTTNLTGVYYCTREV